MIAITECVSYLNYHSVEVTIFNDSYAPVGNQLNEDVFKLQEEN